MKLKKIRKFFPKKKQLKRLVFFIPILIFVFVLSLISPESITEKLGTQNTYIAMFFIALIGGASIFSSVPYPLFLITFSLGGANPLILACITTIAVMIGDSLSYILGRKGKSLIRGKSEEIFEKILSLYESKQRYLLCFFFLYGAFSPFPNDLITFSSGLKKYSYVKMILPLSAGNLIFCMLLSHFAEYFAVYF